MTRFSLTVPNYGPFGDPEVLIPVVLRAEELRFDGVWFADHIVVPDYAKHISLPNFYESTSLCAFGLGATSRLGFGIDVLVLPYRNPIVLAKQAATLDRLSKGRLAFGIGVGFLRGEFDALGVPYERRAAVTEEYLRAIRALWSTYGPVSFEGEWVRFSGVHFEPKPSRVPLYVGGNIARARLRAAEFGDGWHPLWPAPDDYAAGRATILDRRAALGLGGDFTFSYSCPLTRVTDGPAVNPIPAAPQPHADATMEEMRAEVTLPPDYSYSPPAPMSSDGHPMFFGTADQVAADIEMLVAAGVEHFALRFSFGMGESDRDSFLAQIEHFAEKIIPRFA